MEKNSSEYADGQQETGKAIHSFMDMVAWEAEQYAADHTSPMSPLLEEIEDYTLNKTESPSWLTGRIEGRFLQLIIVLSGFRNVIDIGTFTGYSALAMAESIPPDGKVLTIEHNSANADIAQGFFDRSPQGYKINLQRGEAINILKSLPPEATDLVFIDADKANYLAYYHESMRILRKGGLIVVDNALWYGRIFEAPPGYAFDKLTIEVEISPPEEGQSYPFLLLRGWHGKGRYKGDAMVRNFDPEELKYTWENDQVPDAKLLVLERDRFEKEFKRIEIRGTFKKLQE